MKAQYSLGTAYYDGKGVKEDARLGYAWQSVSAAHGYDFAKQHYADSEISFSYDALQQAKIVAFKWTVGQDLKLDTDPPGYVGLGIFNLNAPFTPGK